MSYFITPAQVSVAKPLKVNKEAADLSMEFEW